ncbi:RDD family protein [Spirosoma foliorum]|uniref:RDD family protein n=1 Tax=Spirosoma foliorum TaxID=2710596 RepID=A0A7G5H4K1_9BACT|nr:RDD family protein [Spirosoma foliorum]QMW06043.1 RDD family protein [Spirosoma foliorum]
MNNVSRDLLNADELLATPITPTSRLKRLANLLLDTLFFYIIVFTIGGVVILIYPEMSDSLESVNPLLDRLISTLLFSIYCIVFESWLGRTPGKLITKTKVVNSQGEKPDFNTLVVRNFARVIPFDAFTFLRETPIGLHDRLAHTMVIDDRPSFTLDQSLRNLPD